VGINDTGRAPAVRRAAAALEVVARSGHASVAEISRDLNLAKSSASDLLSTMLTERMLTRRGGALVLGELLAELAAGFVGNPNILQRFALYWNKYPPLEEHTLSLQALLGTQNLCVDVRIGRHVLPYTPRAGSRLPVWDGARGEPILAHVSADDADATLRRFRGFNGAVDEREGIVSWIREHAPSAPAAPSPLLSSTGNFELVSLLPDRAPGAPPVAVTLHLPSRAAGTDHIELGVALTRLAHALAD
jgi:hypothetical protein